jgi:signal transduction histidine kinase
MVSLPYSLVNPELRGWSHFGAMISALKHFWQKLTLAQQFALAALLIIVPCAMVIAWWVPQRINDAVIKNSAAGTVLYMDGLMVPLVPLLVTKDGLSLDAIKTLDSVSKKAREEGKLVSIKVWSLDGKILYSTFSDLIGMRFEPSDSFLEAREGGLGVSFDETGHEEDKNEQAAGVPLLEVYAPVRDPATRQVLAVSEFYADGSTLRSDIAKATRLSWLVVGLAASALVGVLSFIVSKASELILNQRQKLESQVNDLRQLLSQNDELRENLRRANEKVARVNEKVLERVGADLHDGPAQLLTFAMLRMSRIKKAVTADAGATEAANEMSGIIAETLREIRNLSTGLMLPELAGLRFDEAVEKAVKMHREYTNSNVQLKIDIGRDIRNEALKTCVFRFIQEALTNSFKHAEGRGQSVDVAWRNGLIVTVTDEGPGIRKAPRREGLGLAGMQSRVEALGGTLTVDSPPAGGTRLTARFSGSLDLFDRPVPDPETVLAEPGAT